MLFPSSIFSLSDLLTNFKYLTFFNVIADLNMRKEQILFRQKDWKWVENYLKKKSFHHIKNIYEMVS